MFLRYLPKKMSIITKFISSNRIRMTRFLIVASFVFLSLSVSAQPGTDPNDGNPPAPITGIEYLIGGGALIAARYFYKKGKK